eukprot:360045-Chlamydomonas_euryale.AAC.5
MCRRYKLVGDGVDDLERLRNNNRYKLVASYSGSSHTINDVSAINTFLSPLVLLVGSNRSVEVRGAEHSGGWKGGVALQGCMFRARPSPAACSAHARARLHVSRTPEPGSFAAGSKLNAAGWVRLRFGGGGGGEVAPGSPAPESCRPDRLPTANVQLPVARSCAPRAYRARAQVVDASTMQCVSAIADTHARAPHAVVQAVSSLYVTHAKDAYELFATAAQDSTVKVCDG